MHVAGGGGLTSGGQAFLGQVATATGAGGAPDIKFDKDGVQTLISELKAIVDEDVLEARQNIMRMSQVMTAPGHPVGDRYLEAVREFGGNYGEWSNQYIDAVKETIDLLETTIKEYEGRDDEEARRFNEGLST